MKRLHDGTERTGWGGSVAAPEDDDRKPAAVVVAPPTSLLGEGVAIQKQPAQGGQQSAASLQTPHTLRLLKLIRDGGSHAETAVVRLHQSIESSSDHNTINANASVQLWDLLGRLQAILTAPEWRTREAAARALQVVANRLPVQDQLDFMSGNLTMEQHFQDEDETTTIRATNETEKHTTRQQQHFLTVPDLLKENNGMDRVLAEGRRLFATADARFDRSSDSGTTGDGDDTTALQGSSAQERIRLQRQFLAQRLGLVGGTGGVLGDILKRDEIESMDAVTSSDLCLDDAENIETAVSPKSKYQQQAERIYKRLQKVKQHQQGDSSNIKGKNHEDAAHGAAADDACLDNEPPDGSVHALMLLEVQQKCSSNSQRSPQQLLATELLYRMMDPVWYVRHGAILGIMALLRAWRRNVGGYSDDKHVNSSSTTFGAWPHDILARSLCVLALDRFGDFSGAAVDSNDGAVGSSVVAPVREVAGQLVAVLLAMADSDEQIQESARRILFHLTEYSDDWEVRHGALIALKFITVVESTGVLVERSRSRNRQVGLLENIAKRAMVCLADSSDDVKSVAAQILVEMARSSSSNNNNNTNQKAPDLLPTYIWNAALPVWLALQETRAISSCIVDLVSLFSELISSDASIFMERISASVAKDNSRPIDDVARLLLELLDSDFLSVRTSALRSITLLAKNSLFVKALSGNGGQGTFSLLVERVFELFFTANAQASPSFVPFDDEKDKILFRDAIQVTWKRLSDISCDVLQTRERDTLELRLLSRYFGIGHDKGATVAHELPQVDAARKIAYFICTSQSMSGVSELVRFSLSALHSPLSLHCEATCLLYRALKAQLAENDSSLEDFDQSLDPQMALLCLRIARNDEGDDRMEALCDQAFDKFGKAVACGSRSAAEASNSLCRLWVETVQKGPKLHLLLNSEQSANSVATMRVRTTLGGAILAKGLPTKITPLIRVLMTSFNNEFGSFSRRKQTDTYLTQLLIRVRGDTKFDKALNKILDILCDAAALEDDGDQITQLRRESAQNIVRAFVVRIPSDQLKEVGAIWTRLCPLLRSSIREVDDEELVRAMSLLQVISVGHAGVDVAYLLIEYFTPGLIEAACHHGSYDVRGIATSGLASLCQITPRPLLDRVVPLLIPKLRDPKESDYRLAGCLLLNELVKCADTDVCPFVHCLLPLVLSLVTDDHGCAQSAYSIFASLVRVAPLVRHGTTSAKNNSAADKNGKSVIDHLIFGEPLPSVSLPHALTESLRAGNISLRQYQREGVAWLRFLQSVNLSGALCDDMGIGKTLQALTCVALAHCDDGDRCNKSLSLVVCPSTLVGHWTAEIEKYFPVTEKAIFCSLGLTGNRTMRETKWQNRSNHVNIIVTSYSTLRSDIDYLERESFCYCILDEGHLMKNPKTATARASRRIRAKHKLVLTGTPVQNRVNELWAIFDFLMPNFLGTSTYFVKTFASPIAKSQLPGASATCIAEGMTKLKILHQQVLPFILRREKSQVLSDLPPSTLTVVRVPMSSIQKSIYRDFCARRDTSLSLKAFGKAVAEVGSATMSNQVKMGQDVLKSLLFLRLLCTHPSLVLSDSQRADVPDTWLAHTSSGKMLALAELLREAGILQDELLGVDNDTSLLYCDDDSEDQDAFEAVIETGENGVHGFGSTFANKLGATDSVSKCLIFAQFTKSLDAVEDFLFKPHLQALRYVRLDGSIPPGKRMKLVDTFNKDQNVRVLLLTTRIGGLGLNLTAANTVIFLESDYNPFADLQAMDRCRRIGQTQVVNIYRLVSQDTIEEKILVLQEKKRKVADSVVNTNNSTMYSMGTDRLLDIFSSREDRTDGASDSIKLDYDLEGLIERCSEDYASLSVNQFTSSVRGE